MDSREKQKERQRNERRASQAVKRMLEEEELDLLANSSVEHTYEFRASHTEEETPNSAVGSCSSATHSISMSQNHDTEMNFVQNESSDPGTSETNSMLLSADEQQEGTVEEMSDNYYDYDWQGCDDNITDELDNQNSEVEIPDVNVDFGAEASFSKTSVHLTEINKLLEECGEEEPNPDQKLKEELSQWANRNHIVHNSVNELLAILRNHGHSGLPRNVKALLQTPRDVTSNSVSQLAGGSFWYNGILKGMKHQLTPRYLKDKTTVCIDIFIDGLSPYKSVRRSVWPIAGCLVGSKAPFIIGLWCGNSKEPSDVCEFMRDFVNEAKELMIQFSVNDQDLKLEVRNYIADAPARAFLRRVKMHNSYYSCERCHVRGEWKGRMTYNIREEGELRTDETFRSRLHQEHHLQGASPLEELGTNMITQCPIDGMHLLWLGIVKRILKMLCESKASQHVMTESVLAQVSSVMNSLALCFPSEFSRKPRPLTEWRLFKATELRRIVLYDGIVVFKGLDKDIYGNFLILHCALRILADSSMKDFYDDADYLLRKFVKHAGSERVYSQTFVVYNVHHLTHFAAECKRHGAIDDFSAFKYESFLGTLRTYLHAPGRTLPQIVCRLVEQAHLLPKTMESETEGWKLSQPHHCGPLLDLLGHQYHKVESSKMMFRHTANDSCCSLKNGDIIVIKNIVQTLDREIWIVGKAFHKKGNFYTYPTDSSDLGIFQVSKLGSLKKWLIKEIHRKCVLLPLNDSDAVSSVCLPLLS